MSKRVSITDPQKAMLGELLRRGNWAIRHFSHKWQTVKALKRRGLVDVTMDMYLPSYGIVTLTPQGRVVATGYAEKPDGG